MLGAIDLTTFTGAQTDLLTAVGTIGAGVVTVAVAGLSYPFIVKAVKRIFRVGASA
jgi:hypothetical protein